MVFTGTLIAAPPPLRVDDGGAMRVGDTRVSLDSVISAFANGNSAEAIVLRYPSLSLTDVYSVIAYYLWTRAEVDGYLAQRKIAAAEIRQMMELRFSPEGVRDELLSRQQSER